MLNSSGDPHRARPEFDAAVEAAFGNGFDQLAIDALHMLAIVAPASGQDELNRRALDIAQSSEDPRARQWRASLLNNMGWTAFDRGDFTAALALFEEALGEWQKQGNAAAIVIARWSVARTLRELGRAADALAIQLRLADELGAAGKNDPDVDEEIAACRAALAEQAPPAS